MIFDPKLLSKIVHSQLIQAALLLGVKKADSMKKDILIPAFIKAVEAVPEAEQEGLDDKVVTQYNHIVTTFGLDQEPEAAAPPVPTTEEPPPVVPEVPETPVEAGESSPATVEVPQAVSPAQPIDKSKTKEVKEMAKKEVKKTAPKKESYSRIQAFADAIKAKKSGKIDALVALANQKYVSKGGKDNAKEAAFVINLGLKVLVGMGNVTLENDSFKLS